jgi:hypothetical protein
LANRDVPEIEPSKCLLLGAMALSLVLMPLLSGGMGPAPVIRLATRVAHALAAPEFVPVSRMRVVPVKPAAHSHSARRHLAAAASGPAPTSGVRVVPAALPPDAGAPVTLGNPATANIVVPATQDTQTATISDPIVCRLPQPLPGSRFSGPTICKSKSEWAQLRAQGKDVSADGRTLVETSEKYRTLHPQACGAGTMGGGGATTANFTTFSQVCF